MSRNCTVIGLVSTAPIDAKALLRRVGKVSSELGIEIQLVDASKVYGKEHLEVAAERAIRAFEEGRAFGKTRAVEVILYASGKRQIAQAIRFMGIRDGATEIGAVAISGPDGDLPADLDKRLGLDRDDKVLEGSEDVLDAFGIGPEARNGISKDRWGDLVLERVALLDLEK